MFLEPRRNLVPRFSLFVTFASLGYGPDASRILATNPYDIKKRFPTVRSVGNVYDIHNELFSESEFFDQLAVTREVGLAQIGEQAFSFTY